MPRGSQPWLSCCPSHGDPTWNLDIIEHKYLPTGRQPASFTRAHSLPTATPRRNTPEMRIACLQFAPQVADVDNNLNRADAVLSRANPEELDSLDLLVVPEMAFSGELHSSCRPSSALAV